MTAVSASESHSEQNIEQGVKVESRSKDVLPPMLEQGRGWSLEAFGGLARDALVRRGGAK